MDMNLLHDVTFYVMYAAMAIAIFIAIERGIYFAYVRRQARALIDALGANVHSERDLPQNLTRRDSLPLNMILPVLAQKATHGSRKDLRPFNGEELHRILRVGLCLDCHRGADDPAYRNYDPKRPCPVFTEP